MTFIIVSWLLIVLFYYTLRDDIFTYLEKRISRPKRIIRVLNILILTIPTGIIFVVSGVWIAVIIFCVVAGMGYGVVYLVDKKRQK